MQVTFTGINNIKLTKSSYDKYGSYLSADYNIKTGKKHCTILQLECNLTDDDEGNDLTNFKDSLLKCSPYYQDNCIDKNNPNKLTLVLNRQDATDEIRHVSMSVFMINDCPITLDGKKVLPIYTYMAHLSKQLAELPYMPDAGKYYMNLLNKSVDEEARKFLDIY